MMKQQPVSRQADGQRFPPALVGLLCAAASILSVVSSVSAQHGDWKHSGSLYINTTPDGADLPAGAQVKDFPLLVHLHGDYFDFSQARPNGEDIRFTTSTGTGLPHEIDRWDRKAGTAGIWVRIPAIRGNDRQEIRIHWGNAGATNESDGRAVFNASNGFVGVWHLGNEVRDVTGNLKSDDNGTSETTGMIGGARSFPGGKGVFCGEDIQVFPIGGSPHSTEVWFRSKATNARIVSWGKEKGQGKVQMWYTSPPSIRMDCYFSNGGLRAKIDGRPEDWNHVVHTYENDQAIVYINGVKAGMGNPRHTRMNIERPARMWIGGWYNRYDFKGDIDEVRVSNVARSADWVRLEYENQKPMQTLVGPVVTGGGSPGLSAGKRTVSEGGSVELTAKIAGAQKVYWVLARKGTEKVVAVDRTSYRLDAGRIDGDESAVIRLKAVYPSEIKTREIPIRIRERIPDPVLSLRAPENWDGRETIEVAACISNVSAMQAGGAGDVDYTWNVSGIATVRQIKPGKLVLTRAQGSGRMTVTATVNNGGGDVVASTTITVDEPASDPWVCRTPGPDEKPMDGQFYARNGTGKGVMYCNGTMDRAADALFIRLYAGDKLVEEREQEPAKGARYSFAVALEPGLIKYRMELGARNGRSETILHSARNIVCGDAYLIDGQSNALATDTREESPRDIYEWVRSFGGPTGRGDANKWVENEFEKKRLNLWCNPVWKFEGGKAHRASKEKHKAQLGWWGMVLARRLVASQKVPVCMIQAAIGGTRIDEHQRNEENPTDLSTMYGRMLWRIRQAKLTHGIRAIMWHQGENDQGSAGPSGGYGWQSYQRYFVEMSSAWKRDLPNVHKYYIFQIWPNSCSMGGDGRGDMLREKQRTIPRLYSNMDILSTLGIKPPGPAHFPLKGWAVFADMLQPLIERDFYGREVNGPITAPNLERARMTASGNAIELEFDQPVVWKPDLVGEFRLDGERGRVASGSVSGNVLTLRLSGATRVKNISYIDETNWSQDRLLVGANGIAALTFFRVPVE